MKKLIFEDKLWKKEIRLYSDESLWIRMVSKDMPDYKHAIRLSKKETDELFVLLCSPNSSSEKESEGK